VIRKNWTALHWASGFDNIPVLDILLQECKRKKVAAYNWKDGRTPVFLAETSSCVESFLNAGLDDLVVVNADGNTLLHHCVWRDIVSESIASSLKEQ
jgi:ankyrin repeat protein